MANFLPCNPKKYPRCELALIISRILCSDHWAWSDQFAFNVPSSQMLVLMQKNKAMWGGHHVYAEAWEDTWTHARRKRREQKRKDAETAAAGDGITEIVSACVYDLIELLALCSGSRLVIVLHILLDVTARCSGRSHYFNSGWSFDMETVWDAFSSW